ncbi:hypothetical protein GPECTOR_27g677 [Gonium pectorale]|uniref:Uncharacterized protein n=1 Tax=Gonium pectorale TaxID=33097 RepID=A0A150GF74_GONPE|nr:hypothetical protein GPECTOR_27g677 [Gonium pectorale]|eukprot:KXZ48507.1 hypothetical protein GPECTOR_27g677 [Gonium pectorale]
MHAAASDPLKGTDYAAFLSCAAAFNERFFGSGLSSATTTAPSLKQYLLPPTFYMTAYRRQAADIML